VIKGVPFFEAGINSRLSHASIFPDQAQKKNRIKKNLTFVEIKYTDYPKSSRRLLGRITWGIPLVIRWIPFF
jgi:hypothetical protein